MFRGGQHRQGCRGGVVNMGCERGGGGGWAGVSGGWVSLGDKKKRKKGVRPTLPPKTASINNPGCVVLSLSV